MHHPNYRRLGPFIAPPTLDSVLGSALTTGVAPLRDIPKVIDYLTLLLVSAIP